MYTLAKIEWMSSILAEEMTFVLYITSNLCRGRQPLHEVIYHDKTGNVSLLDKCQYEAVMYTISNNLSKIPNLCCYVMK